MPNEIQNQLNKIILEFMWESQKPDISMQILNQPISKGGKKCLNVQIRNEAIEIMKLKDYLCLDEKRPTWAIFMDELIKRSARKEIKIDLPGIAINVFLQKWKPKLNQYSKIPKSTIKMIKTANKYGVIFDGQEVSINMKNSLPIWYHLEIEDEKISWNKGAKICLRKNHEIATVYNAQNLINQFPETHKPNKNYTCQKCTLLREEGCQNPNTCKKVIEELIGKINQKWDPNSPLNEPIPIPEQPESEDTTYFKPDFTLQNISEGFRIITNNEKSSTHQIIREPAPDLREKITAYTDEACIKNGCDDAIAAGGIWYGPNNLKNKSIRLHNRFNTNNCSELIAILKLIQETPKTTT